MNIKEPAIQAKCGLPRHVFFVAKERLFQEKADATLYSSSRQLKIKELAEDSGLKELKRLNPQSLKYLLGPNFDKSEIEPLSDFFQTDEEEQAAWDEGDKSVDPFWRMAWVDRDELDPASETSEESNQEAEIEEPSSEAVDDEQRAWDEGKKNFCSDWSEWIYDEEDDAYCDAYLRSKEKKPKQESS